MVANRKNPYGLHFDPAQFEPKWRARWETDRLYEAEEGDSARPKWYALSMFPYTSGDLHVGHWYAEAPADAHARYMRMRGYNVLRPMGFDSFGLPAENAAIERDIHPYKWTMGNIDRMRSQLKTLGAIFDWRREVITCQPDYYRWNQWFFLKFFEKGLAYRYRAPVNWCDNCRTSLAREQVQADGTCERCGTVVYQRDLEQWFFRITDYAEELLDESKIDWPEKINLMQRNWIGRSEGTEIAFGLTVPGVDDKELCVFTTRPDTVYGVTFMVLAPEHPLVPALTTPENVDQVKEYIAATRRQTEIERLSTDQEKTGVPLGTYCVNPLNGERVALWIADYVLYSYATGVVMGVPAHDQRDFEFARKNEIPISVVIAPPDWDGTPLESAWTQPGLMVNSGPFDGTRSDEGIANVTRFLEVKGQGKGTVTYRLRDWLISRQRYWGTPIPIIYCPECGTVPVPEDQLPVVLPEDANFRPTGESPLKYHEGFRKTTCPQCGRDAERETDTMDTFVDSSWYQFRYANLDSRDVAAFDPEALQRWCPIDLYTGGAEHAVMHLLYARFFTKALRDLGLVPFDEPFTRLFNQGTILAADHEKMSKSRGNVINPDDQVAMLGSDAVRAFLMFVGPWDQGGSWSTTGIRGISRWFNRIWDLSEQRRDAYGDSAPPDVAEELSRETHRTVKKVDEDFRGLRFNTAIAALMTLTNSLSRHAENDAVIVLSPEWRTSFDTLTVLLAPIAPHLAEELWEAGGHDYSVHNQSWPSWDDRFVAQQEVTLVVQVDGKLRDRLTVPAEIDESAARELALSSEKVRTALGALEPKRIVYVPGRLVNVVTH
ncbi:MAG: leucine--tRNA ligase [Dehalococcoidia bacterium]|jgi:leucyl-tRNA synthetase|nr:leucine--tRNA ligase [Dehalococcoidia bacterium]